MNQISVRRKGEVFRAVTLCLLLCVLRLLSGCGKIEENSSKELSKNDAKKDNEKIEVASKNAELVKTSYPHTLNGKLREMYEPIWKEYESVQRHGGYDEKIWEEIGIQPYAIWLASAKDEEDTLYYSFIDINQDGITEMLIGRDRVSSIALL